MSMGSHYFRRAEMRSSFSSGEKFMMDGEFKVMKERYGTK
jgi:hypothetical protein